MPTPNLDDLAAIALDAGAVILEHYAAGRGTDAKEKADGSPVTLADEAAEALILAALAAHGAAPVVAEEAVAAGATPGSADVFYLVDPLDGTREFVSGNGEFTVNIARVEHGVPRAGVVYAPAVGLMFGGDEAGAWRARVTEGVVGNRTGIEAAAPNGALRVVASRSHLTDETRTFVERFEVGSFVSSGSSLKFCKVAEGAADLYPRLGRTMEWDTAAGHAVLAAAGGRVLTLEGVPLTYGGQKADAFANPHFIACGAFDPFALAT